MAARPLWLFVCTGNTCRSPLAAALATAEAAARGIELESASAGIAAVDDAPASEGALRVAAESGLDLASHRARLLTRPLALAAARLFVMDERQRAFLRVLAPEAMDRVHVLRAYATHEADVRGVQDPFGGDVAAYRRARDDLRGLVERCLERWSAETARRE